MKKILFWSAGVVMLSIVIILVYNLRLSSLFVRKTKFVDSDYARYAYKITPGQMSRGATQALDGFTLNTRNLTDGSIEAEFIPHRRWYRYYKIIVKPGYTLYFLEHDDDSTSTFEKFLNDDHPFLVDPDGYIVD